MEEVRDYFDRQPPANTLAADQLFIQRIKDTPLLTAEQEVDLAKQIEAGLYADHKLAALETAQNNGALSPEQKQYAQDLRTIASEGVTAKRRFIESNLRLVLKFANEFSGLTLHDRIQYGAIGLQRAVEKFDYTQGNKFSTYAAWWIRQFIRREILRHQHMIHLPLDKCENSHKVAQTRRQFGLASSMASVEQIATLSGLSSAIVHETLLFPSDPLSLEQPLFLHMPLDASDGRPITLGDSLALQAAGQDPSRVVASELLGLLNPMQAFVIKRLYGIGCDAVPLDGFGQYGYSKRKVTAIRDKALAQLRQKVGRA